jgi:hypothetical protein
MESTRRAAIAGGIGLFATHIFAAPSARLDEPRKVEQLSFDDLFHVNAEEAERILGALVIKKLRAALEDFNAVLAYKKPIHARLGKGPFLRDGGTLPYDGDGYKLTVVKSLFSLGKGNKDIDGYTYGPDLELRDIGIGNLSQVSRISFFPANVLKKLLE